MFLFNSIFEFAIDVFGLLPIYIIANSSYKERRMPKLLEIVSYFGYLFALAGASYYIGEKGYSGFVQLFCSLGILALLIIINYKAVWWEILLNIVLIYLIFFVSETLMLIFTGPLGFSLLSVPKQNETDWVYFAAKLLAFFIALLFPLIKSQKHYDSLPKKYWFPYLLLLVASIFITHTIVLAENIPSYLIELTLIVVILMDMGIVYIYESMHRFMARRNENEMLEQQVELLSANLDIMTNLRNKQMVFIHDVKNQLYVIRDSKGTEEGENLVQSLEGSMKELFTYSETGNSILDRIINYKCAIAAQKGIGISVKIQIPNKLPIEDRDVIIILGNLFDNAIQASELCGEAAYVSLRLKYEPKGMLIIQMENSYQGVLKRNRQGRLSTTKTDKEKHGWGIKNIRKSVEKYGGTFSDSFGEGIFKATVSIPVNIK